MFNQLWTSLTGAFKLLAHSLDVINLTRRACASVIRFALLSAPLPSHCESHGIAYTVRKRRRMSRPKPFL